MFLYIYFKILLIQLKNKHKELIFTPILPGLAMLMPFLIAFTTSLYLGILK